MFSLVFRCIILAMSDMKLAFGRRDGRLWHISEVASGLPCGCACPSCDQPLVAKRGGIRIHHFSHDVYPDGLVHVPCAYSPESALHLFAKQLIARSLSFLAPPPSPFDARLEFQVVNAWLEKACGDVVPDVQLDTSAGRIFAEVRVTHAVDVCKLRKLQAIGILAVEIDLANLEWNAPFDRICDAILASVTRRTWLYHPLMKATSEESPFSPQSPEMEPKSDQDWRDAAGERVIALAAMVDAAELDKVLRAAPMNDRTWLYTCFDPAEKLAYHCHLLGIKLRHLPKWLNRCSDYNPFVEPAVVWRTGILLKYAANKTSRFSVPMVVAWCLDRYPVQPCALNPCIDGDAAQWGVSNLTLGVFGWLEELATERLVESDGWLPAQRSYVPVGRKL